MYQLQGPAHKKRRVELQSDKEHHAQITALRKAATCAVPYCSFVFEDGFWRRDRLPIDPVALGVYRDWKGASWSKIF